MKNNNLIKLILVLLFCKVNVLCEAQSACLVKIKDLSFMKDFSPNNTDTSKVYFKLSFKVDTAALADRTFLLFGTEKNSGNVLNTQITVSHQNGSDYLQYLNQLYPIVRYNTLIPLQITKSQLKQIKWLTVYVQDNSGTNSSNLYYQINP
jgi:hypothetical protein